MIRSTIPTTPIPTTTTTQKTGFFSGIRNIFSKKAPTTVVSSTATPIVTTTQTNSLKSNNADTPISTRSPINVIVQTTTSTTAKPIASTNLAQQITPSTTKATTTTTTASSYQTTRKVPTIRDEFPPLPSPKQRPGGVTPTTTTQAPRTGLTQRTNQPSLPTHNAWSTHPTQNPVSGKQPVDSNGPTVATASVDVSDNELETLFENLFKKESTTLFSQVSIDYQGRTYSSAQTDEAPQP